MLTSLLTAGPPSPSIAPTSPPSKSLAHGAPAASSTYTTTKNIHKTLRHSTATSSHPNPNNDLQDPPPPKTYGVVTSTDTPPCGTRPATHNFLPAPLSVKPNVSLISPQHGTCIWLYALASTPWNQQARKTTHAPTTYGSATQSGKTSSNVMSSPPNALHAPTTSPSSPPLTSPSHDPHLPPATTGAK